MKTLRTSSDKYIDSFRVLVLHAPIKTDLELLWHNDISRTGVNARGDVFGSVGLSACLLVSKITQTVINGLGGNLMEGSGVVQ